MSNRPPADELRRSVALLRTEWWLLAGGVAGYLLYGVWVLATGIAIESLASDIANTAVTTVGSTTVSGRLVFAAIAWLLVPAVAATWLLERQLGNNSGNLVKRYRIDNPGVLPAPSGALMIAATLGAILLGPRPPVVLAMVVAGVHLLVRTVAYGRRVYTFSPRRLFSMLTGLSALALAGAWLIYAPGLPAPLADRVARAGVPSVVEAGLGVVGLMPATAVGVLVAVPALLSGAYLAVQAAASRRVRAKAPLADPQKRGEQRYPIMPPVGAGSGPGPPPSRNGASESSESSAAAGSTSATGSESSGAAASSGTAESESSGTASANGASDPADEETTAGDDDRSHTQVFTTDEPIPEDGEAVAAAADEAEPEDAEEEDGWIDDTAIFNPDGATSSSDECGSCGESLPEKSVTFCPNCGERIRR